MRHPILFALLLSVLSGTVLFLPVGAAAPAQTDEADWPMWRHDASRSGVTPHELPKNLTRLWSRQLPTPRPAWPETQPKLRYDVAPEPVVAGKRIFVPSSANDTLSAYDTQTGRELWSFFADAPIRFSPIAWNEKVFFCADDGRLHCLSADTGKPVWTFDGAPADRRIIGNYRLISSWPSRGGPVLKDGIIHFTTSIWPFMGIFIHAVDARTGKAVWTNSGDGALYCKQPHGAPSFAGVAPQGHLVISGDNLILPGGRSTPAVHDLKTGALKYFNYEKTFGGYHIVADDRSFHVRDNKSGASYHSPDGNPLQDPLPDVLTDGLLITSDNKTIEAWKGGGKPEVKGKGKKASRHLGRESLFKAELSEPVGRIHVKAGSRMYGADGKTMTAWDFPLGGKASPVWKETLDADIWTMLAADRKLFVVTVTGRLYAFGEGTGTPSTHAWKPSTLPRVPETLPADLLESRSEGYAVLLGLSRPALAEELLQRTDLHLIVVDSDPAKVASYREKMNKAGFYGYRTAAHAGDPATFSLPPYLAHLVVIADAKVDDTLVRNAFHALRPYGGTALFPVDLHSRLQALKDPQAVVEKKGSHSLLIRKGALPKSGSWTHQYADAAQTCISKDELVRLPLGILWFGGPSHANILPRHGHGPSPQVAGGRLFIEGPDMLRALDVYTGKLLWEKSLPDFGKYHDNTNHQAGAGMIGGNYVSLPDRIYAVLGSSVLELDAATGKTLKEIKEPTGANWGYVGVRETSLVLGAMPTERTDVPDPARTIPTDLKNVIPPNDSWSYLAGSDPAAGWTAVGFDDGSWKTGNAGFGYGDNDDRTKISDMKGKFARVYIRHTFTRAELGGSESLAIMMRYDDGFIVHLNGTEVLRMGVAGGCGAEAGGISNNEAGKDHEYFPLTLPKNLLADRNVLAIEGHNRSAGSSDFTLDPYLVTAPAPGGASARLEVRDLDRLFQGGRYAPGSLMIRVYDRKTGKERWNRSAAFNFRHNAIAIASDRLFCLDSITEKRRKELEAEKKIFTGKPVLLALDLKTGREIWKTEENIFGTFMNYSETHDILLQGGSLYRDRARDEVGQGMTAYQGKDGRVLWTNREKYQGPCLLWKDRIITNGNAGTAFELKTGKPINWSWKRAYGCNTIVGCQSLLLFRSGAAGFADVENNSGTGNLGGFKSSCTSNLIAADGVLTAPDYTRTCSCAYQNQTSLALVHMPENEFWTYDAKFGEGGIGLNFGAPGDRRSSSGTLWIDHPDIGGPSESVEIVTDPARPEIFRRHVSTVTGGDLPWVAASGFRELKSVTVTVPKGGTWKVRLVFQQPASSEPAIPSFDVLAGGKTVSREINLAGRPGHSHIVEFSTTPTNGKITVAFSRSVPVCGLELTRP